MSFDFANKIEDGDGLDEYHYKGRKIFFYTSPSVEEAAHSFPVISALITAYARLKLLKYLKRHEKTVAYTDTDSIKYAAGDKIEKASGKLGDVKFEEKESGWKCFLKPKMYGGADAFKGYPDAYDFMPHEGVDDAGLREVELEGWKIKGMTRIDYAYYNPNTMEIIGTSRRPTRFRESVKRGMVPNDWAQYTKVMTVIDDKRKWIGRDSEPLEIRE
jgi:hypothetical protein